MIEGKGKIVKQSRVSSRITKNRQSRLLKNYDTQQKFYNIAYDRVSQLKSKYAQNGSRVGAIIKTQLQNYQPSRISDWSQNCQFSQVSMNNYDVSSFVRQIKGKYTQNSRLRDISNQNEIISDFTNKVKRLDSNISGKLDSLEERLKQLQNTPRQPLTQRLHRQDRQNISPFLKQKSIDINMNKSKTKTMNLNQSLCKSSQKIKDYLERSSVKEESIVEKIHKKDNEELLGNFQKGKQYSKQFTTFIHRLREQIELDSKFTNQLLNIPRSQLFRIKNVLSQYHPDINMSYFDLSPAQIDPLMNLPKEQIEDQEALMKKLYLLYKEIQYNFENNLSKSFETQTITIFLEEFQQGQITMGHMISYINMRTGKQFRNRAIVKLLKRMNINSQTIDTNKFYTHFVKCF